MYKLIFFLFFYPSLVMSTNFTLDKFKIEINSNFLGEEILLFGHKDKTGDLVIIFEGEKRNAKLYSKIKEGLFWINQTKELNDIPSFFAIFSTPKKSLNELFLIPDITNNHFLISNYTEELYKIRPRSALHFLLIDLVTLLMVSINISNIAYTNIKQRNITVIEPIKAQ